MQAVRMKYVRPSLRRCSILESIAESSASSNITTTPPAKPFGPRRATITSFCVNVPVDQRPSRRASLSQVRTSSWTHSRTQRASTYSLHENSLWQSMAPRRELKEVLAAPPRPSMTRAKSVTQLQAALQANSALRSNSVFIARKSTSVQRSTTPRSHRRTVKRHASRSPPNKPNGRRKCARVDQMNDNVPSYARPTAASQAKIKRRSPVDGRQRYR